MKLTHMMNKYVWKWKQKTLGTPITYKPWWSNVEQDATVQFTATVEKVFEKTDRMVI